jgi:RimJ/RimL family protein N-acetyltransferase
MLIADKVKVRPFEESDAELFYDWLNREESMGNYGDFCMVTKNQILNSYNDGQYWNDDKRYFIIEVENKPIGEAVIHKALNYPSAGVELAICIDEIEFRRKGYGKIVIGMLLDYVFKNQPEINRVQAIMDVDNEASIRLFEGCRFKREGILRGISYHHGVFRDSLMYSMLRDDWR